MFIHPFGHYYEFLAGSNAAFVGFKELRLETYNIFVAVKQSEFNREVGSASFPLVFLCTQQSKVKEAFPHDELDFNAIAQQSEKYQAFSKQLESSLETLLTDETPEAMKVKKQTFSLFIVCLLYSVIMIILAGITEIHEEYEEAILIFLGFLNALLIGSFFAQKLSALVSKFFKDSIGKIKPANERNILADKETISRSIFRHFRRFVFFLLIAFILTKLDIYISENYTYLNNKFVEVRWWAVVGTSVIICAGPILNLLRCAIRWNNHELKNLVEDYQQQLYDEIGKENLRWREIAKSLRQPAKKVKLKEIKIA